MHNFVTLVKRLEVATCRLEDLATSAIQQPNESGAESFTRLASLPVIPENALDSTTVPEKLPESVEGFDAFISGPVQGFVKISEDLGGSILEQANSLLKAFHGQRKFIYITTKAKKPEMNSPVFMELLKPLQESITAVSEIRDSNRGSPVFNLLSVVSESIGFLAWITVEPKPQKHIEEFYGSAQYWGNRVLIEFKDTDSRKVEWLQQYYQVFNNLSEYVKQTFPHGILWNPQGLTLEEVIKAFDQKTSPSSNKKTDFSQDFAPPPPPGPAPLPIVLDEASKNSPSEKSGGLGAVFSELNKGSDITKGLKKVNSDQMTHKNPSLRAGSSLLGRSDSDSSIRRSKSPVPGTKPKPENMRIKKSAVKKFEGNKWFVENFDDESEPIKIETSISQSILISRCKKTTIIVSGKANAISIDNSPNLSIIIDSLVSSIDIIKSPNFAMQVLGKIPTIMIDTVDGAQIYLSKESLGTEIFSSKSSGINLNILDPTKEDGDYEEVPLPAQIRTWIEDAKVKNEIVEHIG